jgi:hypothetical protein
MYRRAAVMRIAWAARTEAPTLRVPSRSPADNVAIVGRCVLDAELDQVYLASEATRRSKLITGFI